MSQFKIDFFELAFLAEACIPPVPIARASFWHKLIDQYYHEMSWNERNKLYEWMCKRLEMRNENVNSHKDVVMFLDRYNPENQYEVDTEYNGKKETIHAFLHDLNNGRYYIKSHTFIQEEYIIEVQKLKINSIY